MESRTPEDLFLSNDLVPKTPEVSIATGNKWFKTVKAIFDLILLVSAVSPSGLFPSMWLKDVGSKIKGIFALETAVLIRSLLTTFRELKTTSA